jgi:hypothetical protein
MREQVEILIYQYKKQHNLDVYSPLEYGNMRGLTLNILNAIKRMSTK